MLVIGIDPGATGALALLYTDTGDLVLFDMPVVEITRGKRDVRQVDAGMLGALLRENLPASAHAYLEKVGAMPGQGVSSMFAFGRAVGVVEGVLSGLRIPVSIVPPQTWMKGCSVVGGKDGSRARAMQLFPAYASLFSRKKDDGRADAALIAYYGAQELKEIL